MPALLPLAVKQATGAWRVTSKDLGRDYEEDLSIHPSGIQDYGPEKTLTPIDVVLGYGTATDTIEAAQWLCERMALDPTSLGWKANGEPQPQKSKSEPPADAAPLIRIAAGKLSDIATNAEAFLIDAEVLFYQRAGLLVRPVPDTVAAAGGRKAKTASLKPISEIYMRDQLCRQIKWQRYRHREQKWVDTDPPSEVAATILDRAGEWRFPNIDGVVTTPTLRPDGTILYEPGYDRATQLLLFEPPKLPPIAEKPSRDDALQALALLDELLGEFPFVDQQASRSVALSALITPVVRGAFPVSPAHVARAPTAGSGKSYLFDTASAIVGQPCHVIAAGKTEEETEKRLAACLLAGYPLTNIDNVNGELGGDFLCQVTERPLVSPRVLGRSEQPQIPNRMTIFATGNNIRLKGDMVRRALICSLDARIERPELRTFKNKPVERDRRIGGAT